MSYEPEYPSSGRSSAAAQKTSLPGIFLIVVGILNLLWCGYLTFSGFMTRGANINEAMRQIEQDPAKKMQAEQIQQMEKMGYDPQKIVQAYGTGFMVLGVVGMILSIITILGGVKMRTLDSYGLAVTGSVVAILPCMSTCCVLGIPFGIWALVVLLSQDVKSAFR